MTNPLELIELGIISGDWKKVAEGYNSITGKSLSPPSSDNSGIRDAIFILEQFLTVEDIPKEEKEKLEEDLQNQIILIDNVDEENYESIAEKLGSIVGEVNSRPSEMKTGEVRGDKNKVVFPFDNFKDKKETAKWENIQKKQEKTKARKPFKGIPCKLCKAELHPTRDLTKASFDSDNKITKKYRCRSCKETFEI